MQVMGLDTVHKQQQKLDVSAEQIARGAQIAAAAKGAASAEPDSLTIARVKKLPNAPASPEDNTSPLIDGAETFKVVERGNAARWWRASLAQDGKNLAVMYQVADTSPWKNAEGSFTHAFIGGDSVDLQLDVPGRGPIRVLAAPLGGKATVVYWQQKAEKKVNPTTYAVANNDANARHFDVVKRLDHAKAQASVGMTSYTVLVTIPLADLGIDASKPADLTGLVGVIFSDPSGTNRVARLYWHDKSTGLVSDVPTESGLNVSKWGPIKIAE
jgi:hypothetical protein